MTNTHRTAIESLRTFATSHGEMAFTHMCTAALNGEAWAVERINAIHAEMVDAHWTDRGRYRSNAVRDAATLRMIRATDTTRPDGAIARSFKI